MNKLFMFRRAALVIKALLVLTAVAAAIGLVSYSKHDEVTTVATYQDEVDRATTTVQDPSTIEPTSTDANPYPTSTADTRSRPTVPPKSRPNVLFIMTDDMRAQLGCYQDDESALKSPAISTPSLDRLASRSLLLRHAYAQFSLCGPSRTSLLTSRRPDVNRIFDNRNYWREYGGNFTTLPQYFKEHGYRTVGIGKIFHRDVSSNDNDPISWTDPYVMPKHKENKYLREGEVGWRKVTKREEKKIPLMDTLAAEAAAGYLKKLAPAALTGEQPFFLAVGFKKPHSSYVCPEEYYDLYSLETEEQFLSDVSWQTITFSQSRPKTLMNLTVSDDGTTGLTHDTLRHLRRGYFSCMSYVDAMVGVVLESLEKLGLADNTIISFVADHGYHFGENGAFGKQSLHETSTHVPMILHVPGKTDGGIVSHSVVESLDLFPTLVDAAGLPRIQTCRQDELDAQVCTQGKSFISLIDHPKKTIKKAALSQIAATLNFMKYSMRTSRFRYTEWTTVHRDITANGTYRVIQANPVGFWTELYDHKYDVEEANNVTDSKEYVKVKQQLSDTLHKIIFS